MPDNPKHTAQLILGHRIKIRFPQRLLLILLAFGVIEGAFAQGLAVEDMAGEEMSSSSSDEWGILGEDLQPVESDLGPYLALTEEFLFSNFSIEDGRALLAFYLGPEVQFGGREQYLLEEGGHYTSLDGTSGQWELRDGVLVTYSSFDVETFGFLDPSGVEELYPNLDLEKCSPTGFPATIRFERYFLATDADPRGLNFEKIGDLLGHVATSDSCALDPDLALTGRRLDSPPSAEQREKAREFGELSRSFTGAIVQHKRESRFDEARLLGRSMFLDDFLAPRGFKVPPFTLELNGQITEGVSRESLGSWQIESNGLLVLEFHDIAGEARKLSLQLVQQPVNVRSTVALATDLLGSQQGSFLVPFSLADPFSASSSTLESLLGLPLLRDGSGLRASNTPVESLFRNFQDGVQLFRDGSALSFLAAPASPEGFPLHGGVDLNAGKWRVEGDAIVVAVCDPRQAAAAYLTDQLKRSSNESGLEASDGCSDWVLRVFYPLAIDDSVVEMVSSDGGVYSDSASADEALNTFRRPAAAQSLNLSSYVVLSGSYDLLDMDGDGVDLLDGDQLPYDVSESLDTDLDGIGNNSDADDDGDGLSDLDEIARSLNPLAADTDEDGTNDLDDQFPLDPTETVDTDGDGLGNNRELSLGLDPELTDTDGDGFGDREELEAGTDPLSDTDPLSGGLSPALLKVLSDLHRREASP